MQNQPSENPAESSRENPVELPRENAAEQNPFVLSAERQARLSETEGGPSTAPGDEDRPTRPVRRRRVKLPVILFVITCLSTFFAGATNWVPFEVMDQCVLRGRGPDGSWGLAGFSLMPMRRAILLNWQDGLIYSACLLAILFTHEMGHFIATLRYRIPASLPFFLPLPISPIGTLGAVIGMDGMKADRKEVFDIGIAGPLAGLVVAVPLMWIGIQRLDLTPVAGGMFAVDMPWAGHLLLGYLRPDWQPGSDLLNTQLNPYFMAAWVGLLVTGLNMLPVSQLDGGHIVYAIFRKRAHWIARSFMFVAIAYMIVAWQWNLIVMITLVMLIGTDHPPTRNDNARLGWFRICLGLVSLLIPLFCLAPRLLIPQ
ncbi:MAG: site-2 protease family protein [Pirellulaceae bacterium]